MAEEVEMTPVAAEPPKTNPLAKPTVLGTAIKPGAMSAKPAGLKMPTQPLKPALKMPIKPMIRKPGSTVTAAPLPKPVGAVPPPVTPKAAAPEAAKPMEALKSATQALKSVTQEIPQQAILRKTGIIADGAMTDAQKEAAKHKTARISLSDAMGVAPVKNENTPMKTIRIKRPSDIAGATKPLTPQPSPMSEVKDLNADGDTAATATITQRKTLKIARPSGAVRPAGKFGVKQPSQATTVAQGDAADVGVADIPDMSMSPAVTVPAAASDGPAWLWALSMVIQIAACAAIGALAFMLFQDVQTPLF